MRHTIASLTVILALVAGSLALSAAPRSGKPNIRVWVNTESGVYHCPGARWYGKTKKGRYLTQKAARASGYRPANGKPCR
jgi:hypothetical protein